MAGTSTRAEGLAPGDGEKPGLERGVSPVILEVAERRHERLLGGFLRIFARAEGGQCRPEDRDLTAVNKRPERGVVAQPGPLDQFGVLHTTSRHPFPRSGWDHQWGQVPKTGELPFSGATAQDPGPEARPVFREGWHYCTVNPLFLGPDPG